MMPKVWTRTWGERMWVQSVRSVYWKWKVIGGWWPENYQISRYTSPWTQLMLITAWLMLITAWLASLGKLVGCGQYTGLSAPCLNKKCLSKRIFCISVTFPAILAYPESACFVCWRCSSRELARPRSHRQSPPLIERISEQSWTKLVSCPLDDLCIDIQMSAMIISEPRMIFSLLNW